MTRKETDRERESREQYEGDMYDLYKNRVLGWEGEQYPKKDFSKEH